MSAVVRANTPALNDAEVPYREEDDEKLLTIVDDLLLELCASVRAGW